MLSVWPAVILQNIFCTYAYMSLDWRKKKDFKCVWVGFMVQLGVWGGAEREIAGSKLICWNGEKFM